MVEKRFAEVRVVVHHTGAAVAHDFRHECADHLRVAIVTTFGNIDIASGEFERSVEFLQAALDVLRAVDDERGNDLHRATDGHGDEDQHGEGQVVFDETLVPVGPARLVGPEGGVNLVAEQQRDQQRGLVRMRRQEEPQDGEGHRQEDMGERVVEDGFTPCHAVFLFFLEQRDFHGFIVGDAGAGGFPDVIGAKDEADEIEQTAEGTQDIEDLDAIEGFHELILERGATFGELVEHECLHDAGAPHGGDVDENADSADPEVHVGQRGGPEFGFPETWGEPIEQAGCHEAIPAQCAGVDVADGPVGVVGYGIDRADREQRPFEGGHAVEGDACGEKLDDGIGAEFVPRAAQGEQAVEHATP